MHSLKTKELLVCNVCNSLIMERSKGIIIKGSIKRPYSNETIIGNGPWQLKNEQDKLTKEDIPTSAMCKKYVGIYIYDYEYNEK